MSQPSQQPRLDVRGAVDLSALARPAAPPAGTAEGAPAPGPYTVDVTEATFGDVVQSSTQYPVVVLLWSTRSPASIDLARDLGTLAERAAGAFALARVDVDSNRQVAAAFQVQSLPSVVAVLAGQPVPLFEGVYPPEQIAAVLDQLLAAAAANGVTGAAPRGDGAGEEPAEVPEPEEPPLAPLHQDAYDAIERGDLDAAVEAYTQALRENPRDAMARAGLAQVELLRRTQDADLQAARDAAAQDPADVEAQLLVADLDVLGGKVEDAFARIIDVVRRTSGEERERARVRLVDLFEVVGSDDPRVGPARRALASALY
ncbi:tetratricopeptide repeat protein [uncultured Cellulomonas sp.]|uniref:tetratricopeptide repeat protein n=1 Tax=uncultured Cellulomonas sp. TaxID=189682 RepID=UPI002606613E|nr:tetratricopeptide repeat protein [uncultured Cellulomonas sp.]